MTSFAEQRINCNSMLPLSGRIFNIQRYSLNDGGGIRTTIFFKGCPHTCPWCANPESISGKIHTIRRTAKCLHCTPCLNNPDECPSTAMERIGYDITLDALLEEILKDDVFYRTSGGGVTLSGGEVLMQAEFASQLLQRLHQLGISSAIETAGDTKLETLVSVATWCDEVLFDLKIMDSAQAKRVLNINQPRVLNNFAELIRAGVQVTPRLPLIPGYTLQYDNINKVLQFLANYPITELHILPFHQYGAAKYTLLNRQYTLHDVTPPNEADIEDIRQYIAQQGYHVVVGG